MFKRRRSEKMRKWKLLILIVFFLSIGFFSFHYYMGKLLETANSALDSGDLKKAELYYLKVTKLPFSNARGHDGLGVVALLQHRDEDAKNHFQVVLANNATSNKSNIESALNVFLAKGAYRQGEVYRQFLNQWLKDDLKENFVDFAIISLGNFELAQARGFLSNAPELLKQTDEYKNALSMADRYESEGEIPILLDRKGEPLMVFSLISNNYEYVTPQLFTSWPEKSGYGKILDESDWKNRISTTIDLDLQRVAHQALKGYEGSIIVMNHKNGEILAAYGTKGISPFIHTFEPGSVIKILTYGAFIEQNGNASHYAPKQYPGNMQIAGKIFYDWKAHDYINSIDEGMAVSCNLMFAQMGVDMGWATLRKTYNRFFERNKKTFLLGTMSSGEILAIPKDDFEMGRIAIGLDGLSSTVVGLIQIPSAIANNGISCSPKMLLNCTTIFGDTYKVSDEAETRKMFQTTTASALMKSMEKAVTFENGTARRAHVDGVEVALKTGTAGARPFDSIMIGIINPADPKLVFAFHLYKGGKCEINGALVASRLQSQIRVIAPQYLK